MDTSERTFMIGLLVRGPVCVPCLALKVGVSAIEIESGLHELNRHVAISRDTDSCEICLKRTAVYRLGPARA